MGLFTSVIPYLLYTYGLWATAPAKASILASVEPVAAMLFGSIFFGEKLTLSSLAGMALVLAAVALLSPKKKTARPASP